MELRLLDDVMALPIQGVVLLSMDETRGENLLVLADNGATLTDVLGNAHYVESVQQQEGLFLLYLPKGDAAYWERLFRKVTVDATLVQIAPLAAS